MHYIIIDDKLEKVSELDWLQAKEGICVFSSKEWENENNLRNQNFLNQRQDSIHFCKLESHSTYMFGTFHIPMKKSIEKKNPPTNIGFAFYILKGKIVFIDDTGMVRNIIERMAAEPRRKGYSLDRCLYEFLVSLIEDDLIYLATIEGEISKIEECILKGELEHFNQRMVGWKKEISRLYRYYSQLADVGERLADNEMDFFGEGERSIFELFAERAGRLQSETQILREYAMQVQDVYQSEIEIRQNDVMKVLTIVTTIFLPLTLIVGWYGMNFANMPELQWKYGYPGVMAGSVLVILLSLWLFKRKNFW